MFISFAICDLYISVVFLKLNKDLIKINTDNWSMKIPEITKYRVSLQSI